jgi:hypothetical protein
MFEKQLNKIKEKIKATDKIRNLDKSVRAYTLIINEKLETAAQVNIQAILFLDADTIGQVYYNRSYAYEKMADNCVANNELGEARQYYNLASLDTEKALKHYEDLDEKNKCRKQLKEDKEKCSSLSKKRKFSEESSQERSKENKLPKRVPSIWANPKEKLDAQADKLNQQQHAYYRRKTSFS